MFIINSFVSILLKTVYLQICVLRAYSVFASHESMYTTCLVTYPCNWFSSCVYLVHGLIHVFIYSFMCLKSFVGMWNSVEKGFLFLFSFPFSLKPHLPRLSTKNIYKQNSLQYKQHNINVNIALMTRRLTET